ncbi:MAG: HesA/MoeB/ThiF family protein [Paracoccus sp. (in: a-proteobacteria)]|nr:HesA/MoeB/ThiF family protein [Paracoccus sp. (in: a-proteobacteria)]
MSGLLLLGAWALLVWVLAWDARRLSLGLLLIWAAITAVHLVAPQSGLASALGGSERIWLVWGGIGAVAAAYIAGLRHLRRRAAPAPQPAEPAPEPGKLTESELDRYARHLVLRELGGPGQRKLRAARVLVAGAGGLGAPVLLYLAAAGVGRITLADSDRVSLSNLQRQVIFRSDDTGRPKVEAARAQMAALNPHVEITTLPRDLVAGDEALFAQHDLVLDGTDRFEARAAINAAAAAARVPLLSGAIAQWEGQVTLFDPARGGPCMACLFPAAPEPGLAPPCAAAGVVGPLPGVIGAMMALEAIKHLAGAGAGLRGAMIIFDGLYGETRRIRTSPRPDCPVCAGMARNTA